MKNIFILLIIILLLACNSSTNNTTEENHIIEWLPEPDKNLRLEYEQYRDIFQMDNDSLWHYLAILKGGCLTGGQYVRNGKFGGEACVMTDTKEWEIFFKRDKEIITEFLLNKMADTITTSIHTCPFLNATTGELAVYGLQNIYKMNWYDFKEFKEFKDRETKSSKDNYQGWLQNILTDKKKRAILINCWKQKADKH